MKCLDWKEKISAYIDGEASPEETRLVEEHLEACASCRALERRMRAMGNCVDRIETDVSPDFREKLFARMEAEELLPRRRSLFVYSLRWAAVPLAAAAAFAVFTLITPEKRQDAVAPQGELPRVAQSGRQQPAQPNPTPPASGQAAATAAAALSTEEREIVAHLEMFEDPAAIEDQGEADTIEIFEPSLARKG